MDLQYDVLIIGSGPGGMTAAIYASRAGLSTAILESGAPGGKLIKTHLVENYTGYESISGVDLAMSMHNHSVAFGASYLYGDVSKVLKVEDGFEVHTATNDVFKSKVVIGATGTIERQLGLEHETKLVGKGVSYCAVCDGAFYRNEEVIVVGGGNSALEESIYLAQFVEKVKIVIRRDVFRADATAQKNVLNNPKIEIIKMHTPDHFVLDKDGRVEGLAIKSVEDGTITQISGKAVFPYIGADPATAYLADLNVCDEEGYTLVDENMRTSIPGLYTIGDMNAKTLRQIVTATSDGAIAAQDAFKFLQQ